MSNRGDFMYTAYYYNYHRNRWRRLLWVTITVFFLLGALFRLIAYALDSTPPTGLEKRLLVSSINNLSDGRPVGILQTGIPLLAWSGETKSQPRMLSPSETVKPLLSLLLPDRKPLGILQSQMPVLADYVSEQKTVAVTAPAEPAESAADAAVPTKLVAPVLSSGALVGIYFTHTGETYALTDGVERVDGKKGGVAQAGDALRQELQDKYGIQVAYSDTVNDTNYAESYVRSQETLTKMLRQNPSLQVVLDIHRDAGKSRANSIVTVDGQEAASVLLVVGSDARAPFSDWQEHYALANEFAAEINKQHPGLCLGVKVLQGRYNQFLHPGAILVEIGSVNNSTAEAMRTGRLLAAPLAEVVKRRLEADKPIPAP